MPRRPATPSELCPLCRSPLIRRPGPWGEFTACSNFPKCRYIPAKTIGVACPDCAEGQLVERQTKDDGRTFYGCHRFPACGFASALKPLSGKCPECSTPYLVEKVTKMGVWVQCPDKKCGWKKKRAAGA